MLRSPRTGWTREFHLYTQRLVSFFMGVDHAAIMASTGIAHEKVTIASSRRLSDPLHADDQEENFMASLGIQPGGNVDTILRDRLAAQRRALGAKGFDARSLPLPSPRAAQLDYTYSDTYAPGVPYSPPPPDFRNDGLNHREYHN